jgi:hypothetical protein
MHRFIAVCSIVICATTLACSSAPSEKVASTSSAQTGGCGGAAVVTLTGFDRQTLVLTGVTADGAELTIQYTGDTLALPADLGRYTPPDPCFAQATAWNEQIDCGLTWDVVERLEHFARFDCEAAVTLGEDNGALTFQPVASTPDP